MAGWVGGRVSVWGGTGDLCKVSPLPSESLHGRTGVKGGIGERYRGGAIGHK